MVRSGKEEMESGSRSDIHYIHGEHDEIGRREYSQLSQWVKTGQECGSNDNIAVLLASERGQDIDARFDVMHGDMMNDEARQPLSRKV
nr:cellulose synthase A catalytic subunit 3 [UDP-forming]-like [Tanacetum cinerariifolium]